MMAHRNNIRDNTFFFHRQLNVNWKKEQNSSSTRITFFNYSMTHGLILGGEHGHEDGWFYFTTPFVSLRKEKKAMKTLEMCSNEEICLAQTSDTDDKTSSDNINNMS